MISDIHGVSGRAMLNGLAAGQRDPRTLAQLARGTMRGKIRQLEEALECSFFTDQHADVLAMMLVTIDHYTAQIEALTARIEKLAEPYLHQVRQLDEMPRRRGDQRPGHHRRDRRRHDRLPHRLPPGVLGQMVTAGQPVRRQTQRSNAAGRGNPYLSAALGEAADQRRTHPVVPRRPVPAPGQAHAEKEGPVATGNSLLTIIHALLSYPDAAYTDLGTDYYERRMHVRRQARNHVRGLERLGYKVTIEPIHHRPRRPALDRGRLTPPGTTNPAALKRRRVLPPARRRLYFRTRVVETGVGQIQAQRVLPVDPGAHRLGGLLEPGYPVRGPGFHAFTLAWHRSAIQFPGGREFPDAIPQRPNPVAAMFRSEDERRATGRAWRGRGRSHASSRAERIREWAGVL